MKHQEKIIIYSLLPRLWGNDTQQLIPSGSMQHNGVGKMADLSSEDLDYIRSLGCNYVWYIGLLEHATKTSFAHEGIPTDHPAIVKGEAGSPYAIRDYYDIAPSLAEVVSERMQEFEALVERSHRAGLRVMIDFVPNHVARTYSSDQAPRGVQDLGQGDDPGLAFSPTNCFYYLPGQRLELPQEAQQSSIPYEEMPARATGNDCFSAHPSINDWFETVKLNYGIDYQGSGQLSCESIPTTWHRMLEILRFWAAKGVDGFRCDMAEMVPEAFWAWALSALKADYPDLIFLAEIYQNHRYAAYLEAGFDFLYDKVGLYDGLRSIAMGQASASTFTAARDAVGAMQPRMCYFLENHDEQRFASDFFCPEGKAWLPSLAATTLSGPNPYLHYFGGELGERGMDAEGFSGRDGRTTIFDYWALDKVQRLRHGGFGPALLTDQELEQLTETQLLLGSIAQHPLVLEGGYHGLNYCNEASPEYDSHRVLSFARYRDGELLLVVSSFASEARELSLHLPKSVLEHMGIDVGKPMLRQDLLFGGSAIMALTPLAPLRLSLGAYDTLIWHFIPLS
ncbi:alpha-amylase family glycosyl hydrolase [Porphyromonas sp. COT-239 OH1446]|uniref:alpha-amylase family glycosyl hydrolase n=1 Tax=Porphyromonas sp. COT-239 OH1446 TaxID=1515613 RepID=UPI00052C2602|nr:alpha-amylase family glycosyl hydrolase [Porphyromonas sp. COT-239 OH1446]KGN68065.1 hypothetical protein HQ37_06790 [Porphyromonas sp. COT-239 OH1446]